VLPVLVFSTGSDLYIPISENDIRKKFEKISSSTDVCLEFDRLLSNRRYILDIQNFI
jgi:hypothetical protein